MNYKYNNHKKKITGLVLIFGLMYAFNAFSNVTITNELPNPLILNAGQCTFPQSGASSPKVTVNSGAQATLTFHSMTSCLLTMMYESDSSTQLEVKSTDDGKTIAATMNTKPDSGNNLYSLGYVASSKSSSSQNDDPAITIKQFSVDIINHAPAEPTIENGSNTEAINYKSSIYVSTGSTDDCNFTLPAGKKWPLKQGGDYTLAINHLNSNGQCNAKITYGAAASRSGANQNLSADDVTFDLLQKKTTLASTNTNFNQWDQYAAGDVSKMIKLENGTSANSADYVTTFSATDLPFPLIPLSSSSKISENSFLHADPTPPVMPAYAHLETLVNNYLQKSFLITTDFLANYDWYEAAIRHLHGYAGDYNGSKNIGRLMMIVSGMMKLTQHVDPAIFKKYTTDYVKILDEMKNLTQCDTSGTCVLKITDDDAGATVHTVSGPQSYTLADTDIAASLLLANQVCQEDTASVCVDTDPNNEISLEKVIFLEGFKNQDVYNGSAAGGVTTPILTAHNLTYLETVPSSVQLPDKSKINPAYSQTDLAMLNLISKNGTDESDIIHNTLAFETTKLTSPTTLPLLANYKYPCTFYDDTGCNYQVPSETIGDGGDNNSFNLHVDTHTIGDSAADVPGFLGSYILTAFNNDSPQVTNVTTANKVLKDEMQRIDGLSFNIDKSSTPPYVYTPFQILIHSSKPQLLQKVDLPSRNAVSFLLGELGLKVMEKTSAVLVDSQDNQINALKEVLNATAKGSCVLTYGPFVKHMLPVDFRNCTNVIMLGLYVDGAFSTYNNPLVKYPDIFKWAAPPTAKSMGQSIK